MSTQRVLLPEEVSELKSHFEERDDIWTVLDAEQHEWKRVFRGTEQIKLTFKNGLGTVEDPLYSLSYEPLSWSEETAGKYMQFLLTKYTGLPWRVELEKLLSKRSSFSTEELARRIIRLEAGEESLLPVTGRTTTATTVRATTRSLSRFLQNLLK